jgi:uncharacterized membrane-anchored protein
VICHACGKRAGHQDGRSLGGDPVSGLASRLVICAAAVWFDRRAAARTEAAYWVAIVAMRAAATNLADILTHDLALGYVMVSVLLCLATLVAARFTIPDVARGGSPRVDSAYWAAMFVPGCSAPSPVT